MFDCNLIKSRDQRMRDYQLPELGSTYQKMQMQMPAPLMPMMPGAPSAPPEPAPFPLMPTAPAAPLTPSAPVAPPLPSRPPESEEAFPINPLLPKFLPTSSTLTVPANPVLPAQYATTLDFESLQYLNGYLRTQIGHYVEAVFLIGSSNISTMPGRLVGVGLNYILIEDLTTGDVSACDFYNIKFFKTHAHGELNLNK